VPLLSVGDPMFGPMLVEAPENPVVDRDARARIEQSDLPFHWIERRGDLALEVAEVAEQADLAVLSSPRDFPGWEMRLAIGRVLVKSGKPVLAVPVCTKGLALNGHALLLWDGSEQAHHALAAAMPLLRKAARVTIVEVDDGSLRMPALHASAFLDHHEIANRIESTTAGGEKAAFPLLEQIRLLAPDYVVMGGFGHPRLIEQLFGGVTEHLLAECPVPLFLKH